MVDTLNFKNVVKNNRNNITPRTSREWCDLFDIAIINSLEKGFLNTTFFNNVCISKEEFMNRVSHCVLHGPTDLCRREAAKMRKALKKK